MKTIGKIAIGVGVALGVGALACYGLKKLLEKADRCACDCDDPSCAMCGCDCECHEECDDTACAETDKDACSHEGKERVSKGDDKDTGVTK